MKVQDLRTLGLQAGGALVEFTASRPDPKGKGETITGRGLILPDGSAIVALGSNREVRVGTNVPALRVIRIKFEGPSTR